MMQFTQAVLVASIFLASSLASAQFGYVFPPSSMGAAHSNLDRATVQDSGQAKLADLGELVLTIKTQIKEAIKEVIGQIVENLKQLLHSFKLKLFKKLGKLTISEVFRSVFGGVGGLVQGTRIGTENVDLSPSIGKPVQPTYTQLNPVYGPQMYWHRS